MAKTMKRFISWPAFFGFLAITGLISLAVAIGFDVGFWQIYFIVAAAVFVVGWVATVEDALPGGFNNPHMKFKDKKTQRKH